jgi:hypothetical protein
LCRSDAGAPLGCADKNTAVPGTRHRRPDSSSAVVEMIRSVSESFAESSCAGHSALSSM